MCFPASYYWYGGKRKGPRRPQMGRLFTAVWIVLRLWNAKCDKNSPICACGFCDFYIDSQINLKIDSTKFVDQLADRFVRRLIRRSIWRSIRQNVDRLADRFEDRFVDHRSIWRSIRRSIRIPSTWTGLDYGLVLDSWLTGQSCAESEWRQNDVDCARCAEDIFRFTFYGRAWGQCNCNANGYTQRMWPMRVSAKR